MSLHGTIGPVAGVMLAGSGREPDGHKKSKIQSFIRKFLYNKLLSEYPCISTNGTRLRKM